MAVALCMFSACQLVCQNSLQATKGTLLGWASLAPKLVKSVGLQKQKMEKVTGHISPQAK